MNDTVAPARTSLLVGGLVIALICARMTEADHAPAAYDALIGSLAGLVALVLAVTRRASRLALGGVFALTMALVLNLVLQPVFYPLWIRASAPASALAFALIVIHLYDKERDFATAGLALAGAATGSVALYQRLVAWPALLEMPDLSPEQLGRLQQMRAFGLSLSPDLAGGIGLLGLFAALHLATKHRHVVLLAFAGLCAALSASQVMIARSNGTFLTALIAVFAMALVSRKKSLRFGALGVAVIVGGAAAASGRLAALPASAGERLDNWRVALDIFTTHPGVGVGIGRFAPAYLAARETGDNITRYAHSGPLQALAELGLVGAVLIAIALIVFGILVVAQLSAGGAPPLLVGLVVVAVVRPIFDYDLQVAQSAVLFAVAIALFTPSPKSRHDAFVSRLFPAMCALWILALTTSSTPVLFERRAALESQDIGPFYRAWPDDDAALLLWLRGGRSGDLRAAYERMQKRYPPAAVCFFVFERNLSAGRLDVAREALQRARLAHKEHPYLERAEARLKDAEAAAR